MLRTAPIRAYIPASDVSRARKFYEQTIGLTPKEEFAGGVIYEWGGAEVFMYPTSNAGTSKASQAFWQVADVLLSLASGGRTCRALARTSSSAVVSRRCSQVAKSRSIECEPACWRSFWDGAMGCRLDETVKCSSGWTCERPKSVSALRACLACSASRLPPGGCGN
jgi:hypothetical protein